MAESGSRTFVGCAGWNLPRSAQPQFPTDGSHLQRYSALFPAVEINSSFYRPHRTATYVRWANSVPSSFRFSVKVPKAITHGLRLHSAAGLLDEFLAQVMGLNDRLGCLLVQLPPSLNFESATATGFFAAMRSRSAVPVACEPRHASWFAPEADDLLQRFEIARVAADPAIVSAAAVPGGWPEFVYFRLHGSPKVYYSEYSSDHLDGIASRLRSATAAQRTAWCIFDNTALGAATQNALDLLARMKSTQSF